MATRDPTNPFGPSLLDIISSLSGAPLNLHMFSALPTSADGPATAASPADAGAQSPSPSSSPAPGDAQPPSMLGSVAAAGDGGLLGPYFRLFAPTASSAGAPPAAPAPAASRGPTFNQRWPAPFVGTPPQPPFTALLPMYPLPNAPPNPKKQFYPGVPGYPLAVPPAPNNVIANRFPSETPWWVQDNMAVPQSADHPEPPTDTSFLQRQFGNRGANDLIDRIIYSESGGNTYSAPEGTWMAPALDRERAALGAGQFTGSTWKDMLARYRPDLIQQNPWLDEPIKRDPRTLNNSANNAQVSASGIMDTRLDYPVSRDMTARYANQLATQLQQHHFPVTPGNVYLMYFAGPGDGLKILNEIARDPNTPVAQIAPKLAASNPNVIARAPTVGLLQADRAATISNARPDLLPFNRRSPSGR